MLDGVLISSTSDGAIRVVFLSALRTHFFSVIFLLVHRFVFRRALCHRSFRKCNITIKSPSVHFSFSACFFSCVMVCINSAMMHTGSENVYHLYDFFVVRDLGSVEQCSTFWWLTWALLLFLSNSSTLPQELSAFVMLQREGHTFFLLSAFEQLSADAQFGCSLSLNLL